MVARRTKPIDKAVREAVDEGLVLRGAKQAIKAIRNGSATLVVISKNCPQKKREEIKREAEKAGVECHEYDGTSLDLGELSKRPYTVSVLTVLRNKKESGSKAKPTGKGRAKKKE